MTSAAHTSPQLFTRCTLVHYYVVETTYVCTNCHKSAGHSTSDQIQVEYKDANNKRASISFLALIKRYAAIYGLSEREVEHFLPRLPFIRKPFNMPIAFCVQCMPQELGQKDFDKAFPAFLPALYTAPKPTTSNLVGDNKETKRPKKANPKHHIKHTTLDDLL